MKMIRLLCSCQNPSMVMIHEIARYPSGYVTCEQLVPVDGVARPCGKRYPILEILRAFEAGQTEYVPKGEQLSFLK